MGRLFNNDKLRADIRRDIAETERQRRWNDIPEPREPRKASKRR